MFPTFPVCKLDQLTLLQIMHAGKFYDNFYVHCNRATMIGTCNGFGK